MTKLTALIGYPVEHSLSPVIHDYWLKQHGIDGAYKLLTTPPTRLRQTMLHMRKKNAAGVNVTVPHKQAVMEHLDSIDALAEQIGAVNTILNRKGKFIGTNTDAYGFITALRDGAGDRHLENVVILGAGGATRAVIVALKQAGAKRITLTNRTLANAAELAEEFDVGYVEWESREELLKGATLLVNTTSLGMQGMEKLELSLANLPKTAAVMDIVYAPLETELLKNARAHGCIAIDGLGMLLHQAAGAFEQWHGVKPVVDAALYVEVLESIEKEEKICLINEIRDAFAGVTLEDGVSLNIAEYNDSGGSNKEYLEAAKLDEKNNWEHLSDAILEKHTVTFSFTDLKGFRFYLPAYMIWTLKNHRYSNSIIADQTIYALDTDHHVFENISFSQWFTEPQMQAIIKFLTFCCHHGDTLDNDIAEKNLQKILSQTACV